MATKYSLECAQIHLFLDENGRLCLIILTAILFRLVSTVLAIGEDGADRKEYMDIKKRSSATMERHGEDVAFALSKAVKCLRKIKQKLNWKRKGAV